LALTDKPFPFALDHIVDTFRRMVFVGLDKGL
jgi:hypothetical protein